MPALIPSANLSPEQLVLLLAAKSSCRYFAVCIKSWMVSNGFNLMVIINNRLHASGPEDKWTFKFFEGFNGAN